MTVISHKELQAHATGTADKEDKRKFTAPYQVTVDDAKDGPNEIIRYLRTNGIYPGVPYRYGNDVHPLSFCDGITPTRVSGSTDTWNVSVTYSPAEGDKQDEDGNPTEDPTKWRMQHRMGYSARQEPVWKAENRTAFPHPDAIILHADPYTRAQGTSGPVVNSAGVVLDPPLMKDVFDRVWQVTTFALEYDTDLSDDTFMGRLNADTIKYHNVMVTKYGFKQITVPWPPYWVKCTDATATFKTTEVASVLVNYWEWHWEFQVRNGGWLDEVLDRGISARAVPSGPDGDGGTLPATIPEAAAAAMPVLDGAGRRVPEMVLFDGAGWPISAAASTEDTGFYFKWLKDDIAIFSAIPFPLWQIA